MTIYNIKIGTLIIPRYIFIKEQPEPPTPTEPDYLTFEITGDGYINWHKTSPELSGKTIEYKKNDGEWTEITPPFTGWTYSIPVQAGDVLKFRGDNDTYGYKEDYTLFTSSFSHSTAGFKVKGNVMSLINSTDFSELTSLPIGTTYNFADLFFDCTGLTDASELLLPATTLNDSSYLGMFSSCTSLTGVPNLPATTLADNCYDNMFGNCRSLTGVPTDYLPATTLAKECYFQMFGECTSLTTAPELPATTLVEGCYYNMFFKCTSLTTAPALPATTLTNWCYCSMFQDCTSLNYVKCLARNVSAYNCTASWLKNVPATGTIETPSSTNWTTGRNGIPEGWTRVDSD